MSSLPVPPAAAPADALPADRASVRWVTTIVSLVVGALGCVVLAGWVLDVSVMKSGIPGLVEMKANTGLCFVLAGGATWLLGTRSGGLARHLGRTAAVAVAAIAAISLGEYVLGRDLGIDQLLFYEAPGAVGTSHPGRMAPNTAVAFLLVVGALATLDARARLGGWLAPGLALGAALLAFVALVGYVGGVTSLYAMSRLTQMAVPTAIAFVLLAIGVVCSRAGDGPMRLLRSDTVGGKVIRMLLPTALAVPMMLGAVRLAGEQAGLFDDRTGTWLFALAIIGLLIPLSCALAVSLDRAELASRRAHAARQDVQRERAAFDEAPIGSALVSLEGRFTRVNQALCSITGYSTDELVGKHFMDITLEDDSGDDVVAFAAMVSGSLDVQQVEKRYVRRDGGIVHVRVSATAIYDEDGVSHIYAQTQDVTESRLAAQRVEEAQFETLARLAAAAEYRDDDTAEHTRRVGELAGRLAEQLGLGAEAVRLIRLAAPLHDIGKIGIPDAILLKPGPLTGAELTQMRRHTTIGAQMLSGGAHPQLAMAEQIAATHHEHWDGSGYPRGLTGTAIPIAGRIVAVADVFDALTHTRPYKEAWTLAQATAELRGQRGRKFDPEVVDAFFQVHLEDHAAPEAPRFSSASQQPGRADHLV